MYTDLVIHSLGDADNNRPTDGRHRHGHLLSQTDGQTADACPSSDSAARQARCDCQHMNAATGTKGDGQMKGYMKHREG